MGTQGKKYQPSDEDREFVERAIMAGAPINNIADCLNISDDTLRKYYKYEIAVSRQNLVNKAVGVVGDSLVDGSLDAAKYVLSRVAGWTERQNLDHTTNGKDMPAVTSVSLNMTPEQAAEAYAANIDPET